MHDCMQILFHTRATKGQMCVGEGRLCDHYLHRCNNMLRAYDPHHSTVCHANAVYRIGIALVNTYASLLA